ncbi:MAG: hypothetical protein ACQEXJ_17895 [Myxococcota bacterium]
MKQKRRYRRKTKGDGLVSSWPDECDGPEQLADRVAYVGSAEHKARPVDPSFQVEPELRSDASKCPRDIDRDNAERVLREALRRRCVSQRFESGFPRYAWGWLDGTPYVARLTNREKGAYKGWPIEPFELPTDREGLLAPDEWEEDDDD